MRDHSTETKVPTRFGNGVPADFTFRSVMNMLSLVKDSVELRSSQEGRSLQVVGLASNPIYSVYSSFRQELGEPH
jgi:hypothetical protein